MARYTTEGILAKAIEELERDDNILFMDDVIASVGVSKPTFYTYIEKDGPEYNEIWERITANRINVKKYIRLKLRVSGKAAELLALYRMIATDEERKAINQQYVEMSGGVDNNVQIEFVGGSGRGLAHSEDEVDAEREKRRR